MTRRKASIYHIASNHSRSIQCKLDALSEAARNGEVHGLTYAISDKQNNVKVGRAGNHQDTDKAIGALFRAAVSLVLAA